MHSAVELKKADGSVDRTEPPRIKAYLDAGAELPFPDLSDYQSMLWRAFLEVGPTLPGAMGEVPVSWVEVDAYARHSPEITEPWEVQALVQMSQDYLSEKVKGADVFTVPPMERGS
ncbi:hypothetical protein [Phaeobacter sp. S60]|uniref:hypothetical protein n=1 Tax=Phaeobacter sp. S60 TaxID=1569353 RepID=UPI000A83F9A0|nr:hypothetical protein [Phaeobacter sp. S60]